MNNANKYTANFEAEATKIVETTTFDAHDITVNPAVGVQDHVTRTTKVIVRRGEQTQAVIVRFSAGDTYADGSPILSANFFHEDTDLKIENKDLMLAVGLTGKRFFEGDDDDLTDFGCSVAWWIFRAIAESAERLVEEPTEA